MIPEIVLIISLVAVFALLINWLAYANYSKSLGIIVALLGTIYMVGVPVWLYQSRVHRAADETEIVLIKNVENNDGSVSQIASFTDAEVVNVTSLKKQHYPDGTKLRRDILKNSSMGIYWMGKSCKYEIVPVDE